MQPFGIIDAGAFFILGKRTQSLLFIAVNLPTAAAFTAISLVKNEAPNILGRITEEQPYFVRKSGAALDPAFEPIQTILAVKTVIAQ